MFIVLLANANTQPHAMMVKVLHAHIAVLAVNLSVLLWDAAFGAPSVSTLGRRGCVFNVALDCKNNPDLNSYTAAISDNG